MIHPFKGEYWFDNYSLADNFLGELVFIFSERLKQFNKYLDSDEQISVEQKFCRV